MSEEENELWHQLQRTKKTLANVKGAFDVVLAMAYSCQDYWTGAQYTILKEMEKMVERSTHDCL